MTDGNGIVRSVRALNGYAIGSVDGDIGRVRDVYFHDATWNVRFVVVETSHWLHRRRGLISPRSLCSADHASRILRSTLTKIQVAHSPDIDTERPVSRQHEIELFQYYLPTYWSGSEWGGSPYAMANIRIATRDPQTDRSRDDRHLRSAHAITHYYVHAVDGDMGHVADFLYDDTSWKITHVVVTSGNFGHGRRVLVPVNWITGISWDAGTIDVSLTGQEITLAPVYDAASPVHRDDLADGAAHYATLARLDLHDPGP